MQTWRALETGTRKGLGSTVFKYLTLQMRNVQFTAGGKDRVINQMLSEAREMKQAGSDKRYFRCVTGNM